MVGVPADWTLDYIPAFLSSFVAVTILLCGLFSFAHVFVDGWQMLAKRPNTLVYVGTRKSEDDQPKPPDSYVGFREGVVFAVGYAENGNLKNNTGICPDPSQIAWLREFKKSIAACGNETDSPLQLQVRGFASIAPLISEETVSSEDGNLEIANQRGRIIARFLAFENETFECCGPTEEPFCAPGMEGDNGECSVDTGNYIVTYRDWSTHEEMRKFSPVDDGGRPTPRYSMEFLNRSVHIAVMNNACWNPLSRDWLPER